ncbi:hypothetical protein RO3G_12634 [Lichtheimia corymbifera JMRC:FSU:9682]|uniref:Ricin B lectin domain-containing protein n=1 Tax=Lichtheimia corymbifera JMRC:FSU:9682 TaxID=1263082 RepID=A0A068S667_9FUNG|nr:hypothetical protein RO3G_12634 [Lichtheimia corymbifera JMRC:FSU:9682]
MVVQKSTLITTQFIMTVTQSDFPIGYFYIISKMHGLVLDIRGDVETAAPGTKIVMAEKKPESPERDSQLWIHQRGFLTNKATGLVLDINTAQSFIAIFTGEKRLYLDTMKEEDVASDQRFGYERDTGFIYSLANPDTVIDIRHENPNVDARLMMYKRKLLVPAEGKPGPTKNQLWELELSDPPREVDSDDEDEDDSKRARFRAWFGNWTGWSHNKREMLNEEHLTEAHKKVYEDEEKKKKSTLSYELIAGAVAFQAVRMWEKKQEEEGKDTDHKMSKELIASFAASELVKLLASRGEDADDEEGKSSAKKRILTKMAIVAATNYFETRHGSS